EEDDAEVGAVVLRLGDEAAVHVGVAARLVDEQPAEVVEARLRVAPLLEDRLSPQGLTGHDAEGLAAGVVVDGADLEHAADLGTRGTVRGRWISRSSRSRCRTRRRSTPTRRRSCGSQSGSARRSRAYARVGAEAALSRSRPTAFCSPLRTWFTARARCARRSRTAAS